jgi:hypothetical protein
MENLNHQRENRFSHYEEFELLKNMMIALNEGDIHLTEGLRKEKEIESKAKLMSDYKLLCFALKVKIAIFESLSDKNDFPSEKLSYLEEAHKFAKELLEMAQSNNCLQPSHIKRLAITKRKLAAAVSMRDPQRARMLETDAMRLLIDVIKKSPDYGEAFLELAEIQKQKLLRELNSLSRNISTAKTVLKKAKEGDFRKNDSGIDLDLQRVYQLEKFASQMKIQ